MRRSVVYRDCVPLLAVVFLQSAIVRAEQPTARGAKEIFLNSEDGSVITGSANPVRLSPPPRAPGHLVSARPLKRLAPASTRQSPVGIHYWIELVQNARNEAVPVAATRIFHSGERIRLHFTANAHGHIALLQIGSHGAASILFPDPAKGLAESEIEPRVDRVLPGASYWFRFDDHPGTERLLVLFAKSPEEIENFPGDHRLDTHALQTLVRESTRLAAGKDLLLETETEQQAEVGTYGVNLIGKPVILEIELHHS
jgi:Domain of unknown function (DUF4384)